MSDAIIAKALNSTIGTKDFVGLDEIFNSHLNRLDEILQKNAEDIKEVVSAVEKISNRAYAHSTGDPAIASLVTRVTGGSLPAYSKYINFEFGGFLRYEIETEEDSGVYAELVGDGIILSCRGYVVFSPGARIAIRASAYEGYGGGAELFLFGHTEYAPEIKYTIE